ncbi:hypothetical protein DPSP01_005284 [Paraphaeosphaeria sporulosa]
MKDAGLFTRDALRGRDIKLPLEESSSFTSALQAFSTSFKLHLIASYWNLSTSHLVFLVDMHTLSTLRLSGVLPGAFRRFMIPFEASPSVTTLSIDSLGAINSTALEHEQFNTSTASLERVMTSPIGLHEHANGDIRQCGPPPRTVWYCCNCGDGPHNIKLDTGCSSCGQTRCGSCTTGSAK